MPSSYIRTKTRVSKLSRRLSHEPLEKRLCLAHDLVGTILPFEEAGPQIDAQFGSATALNDDYRVVGSPFIDEGGYEDNGLVFVYDSSDNLLATIRNPDRSTFDSLALAEDDFGHSLAISGDQLIVGAPGFDIGRNENVGAAYLYDLSNVVPGSTDISPLYTLTLADPTPGHEEMFGSAIAFSGDTIVIGAKGASVSGVGSAGMAYIYDIALGTPLLVEAIHKPTPEPWDGFGVAVATDGQTVVVGSTSGTFGEAFVFDISSGNATLTASLSNLSPTLSAFFGNSVAVEGDTIVISAYYHGRADHEGVVYIYDRSDDAVQLRDILRAPNPSDLDRFGYSVSLRDSMLAVGAPGSSAWYLTGGGDAYLYNAGVTPPLLVGSVSNAVRSFDEFGRSVSVSGTSVLIGSPQHNEVGSAFVYDFADGEETLTATLENQTRTSKRRFGQAVDIDGDLLVVGVPNFFNLNGIEDRVQIFEVSESGSPVALATIESSNSHSDFGKAVSIGGTLVAIGSPSDNSGVGGAGSVYVYDVASGTPVLAAKLLNPSPSGNANFGAALDISGTKIVVGVPRDMADGMSLTGIAYVYELSGVATGSVITTPTVTLKKAVPVRQDEYGISVAIEGNTVIVGASGDDTGGEDFGAAFVYDITNVSSGSVILSPTTTLISPEHGTHSDFGISVAVSDNLVVVAEERAVVHVFDLNAIPEGAVSSDIFASITDLSGLLFRASVAVQGNVVVVSSLTGRSVGGVLQDGAVRVYNVADVEPGSIVNSARERLFNPAPNHIGYFGGAIAISENRIVVAAPGDDTQNFNQGAVYVYEASDSSPADFNEDGLLDRLDINSLQANIVNGPQDPAMFDLTGDGIVDVNDRNEWLAIAGEINLGPGFAYLMGDANLDGYVSGEDYLIWNSHKFTTNSNWTDGDFTVDGVIGGSDFLAWNSRKFTSSTATWTLRSREFSDRYLMEGESNNAVLDLNPTSTWTVSIGSNGTLFQNPITGNYLSGSTETGVKFRPAITEASYWEVINYDPDGSILLRSTRANRFLDGNGSADNWTVILSHWFESDVGWFIDNVSPSAPAISRESLVVDVAIDELDREQFIAPSFDSIEPVAEYPLAQPARHEIEPLRQRRLNRITNTEKEERNELMLALDIC